MAGIPARDIVRDLRPWDAVADDGTVDVVETIVVVAWLVAAAIVGTVILVARHEDD